MKVRFAASSRRHRIGKAHALHVINTVEPIQMPSVTLQQSKLLWIGVDDRGLELEIVGLYVGEVLLIIHVMPYRFRRR